MNLPDPQLPQIHLRPGELVVTQEARWVITILGSCIALTMFNRRLRFAAMCHAMLPRPREHDRALKNDSYKFRFLSHAVPAMLEHFRNAGVRRDEIEVKMFGGGNVIHLEDAGAEDRWIGNANIQAARELLSEANLTLMAENVGGSVGRKILFNTQAGEVLHKHLGDPLEADSEHHRIQKSNPRNRRKIIA